MTIDERLEFLLKSTESLHASLEAEIAERRRRDDLIEKRLDRADQRERQSRQAVIAAIAAYIAVLNSNGEEAQQ